MESYLLDPLVPFSPTLPTLFSLYSLVTTLCILNFYGVCFLRLYFWGRSCSYFCDGLVLRNSEPFRPYLYGHGDSLKPWGPLESSRTFEVWGAGGESLAHWGCALALREDCGMQTFSSCSDSWLIWRVSSQTCVHTLRRCLTWSPKLGSHCS